MHILFKCLPYHTTIMDQICEALQPLLIFYLVLILVILCEQWRIQGWARQGQAHSINVQSNFLLILFINNYYFLKNHML